MSKRMILLNLLLLVSCVKVWTVLQAGYVAYQETHQAALVPPLATEEGKESKGTEDKGVKPMAVRAPINPTEYSLVSEKNLFLEGRSLQASSAAPVAEVAPPLNPKPVLMGTATIGTEPRAFIQTMRSQPGQRPTKTLKIGDVYEGYRVSQIQRDRVELSFALPSGGTATQILDIRDPATRAAKTGNRTPIPQSQVISVGGGAGAPPGIQASQPMAPGAVPMRTPFGDIPQPPGQAAGAQGGQAGTLMNDLSRQGQQLLQQERQRMQQQASPAQGTPQRRNEIIDEQGRRVIRTPFGDIVRPPASYPPPPQEE